MLQVVVDHAVDVVCPSAPEKRITLSVDIDPHVPLDILGDAGQRGQSFLNLLSNAVKFTLHGSVHLMVNADTIDEQNSVLRFAFRDTGIGMTPDQQKILFQRFIQADKSTTIRFGGTGWGLSIARRLVEMMGRKIDVSSRIGEGRTFWCYVSVGLLNEKRVRPPLAGKYLALIHETYLLPTQIQHLERVGMLASNDSIQLTDGSPDILLIDIFDIENLATLLKSSSLGPRVRPSWPWAAQRMAWRIAI